MIMLGHHDIKPVSHQKSDWPFDFAVDNRVDKSQTFSQVSRQVRSDCRHCKAALQCLYDYLAGRRVFKIRQ